MPTAHIPFEHVRGGLDLEALCRDIAPDLLAWAIARAPWCDGAEVVNETWLRALERLDRYDSREGEFRQWLFGIAKWVLVELSRNRFGRAQATRDLDALPISLSGPLTRLIRSTAVAELRGCILALGERDRRLVHLRLEGATNEEAAAAIGSTRAYVDKIWSKYIHPALRAAMLASDPPDPRVSAHGPD